MSPSDEKHYPLVNKLAPPRGRRSVSARDYALPKPYRKKKYVEDEPEMSKLRVSLLTFSALVVASLVATLVLLARENLDARPVLVIAAPKPAPVRPVALPEPASAFMLPGPRSAGAHVPAVPLPGRAMHRQEALARTAPASVAAPARIARAPRVPPRLETAAAPAPDPDVVLITAILLLTPPRAPESNDPALAACNANQAGDGGCAAIHGMKP